MPRRRYTVRPAEPHEVAAALAAAFLAATTVSTERPPKRTPRKAARDLLVEAVYFALAALIVTSALIGVVALTVWLA